MGLSEIVCCPAGSSLQKMGVHNQILEESSTTTYIFSPRNEYRITEYKFDVFRVVLVPQTLKKDLKKKKEKRRN